MHETRSTRRSDGYDAPATGGVAITSADCRKTVRVQEPTEKPAGTRPQRHGPQDMVKHLMQTPRPVANMLCSIGEDALSPIDKNGTHTTISSPAKVIALMHTATPSRTHARAQNTIDAAQRRLGRRVRPKKWHPHGNTVAAESDRTHARGKTITDKSTCTKHTLLSDG